MKKYTVISAFSLLSRTLIIEEDIIYAELVRQMYHVYSPKTRKLLGKVSEGVFKGSVTLTDH